jgi:hypothetical protein
MGLVVELLLTTSAVVLMLDSRLRPTLAAYVIFTATTLWFAFPHGAGPWGLALFAATALIKVLLGPLAIVAIARRYHVPEYLTPSFNIAWRVGFAALAAVAGHEAGKMAAFTHVALAGVVFIAVFSSIATVLLHRNLLAHVIGLLALGSSISLAGAVFAPGLSGAVELADTFDIVVATFVALAIARAILAHDPHLDVRSLRSLHG